jgi:sugar lactone lactonase YvrE
MNAQNPRTVPRPVAGGLVFPHSPRWRNGRLWLCDMQTGVPGKTGQVISVDDNGVSRTVVDQVPGGPNPGLGWLPDGRLLVVASTARKVLVLGPDGDLSPYADLSGTTALQLNDMVVDASGNAYVGTINPSSFPNVAPTELIVVRHDGKAEIAATGLRWPASPRITPDGRTLVVAESFGGCLTAFDIDGGRLGGRRTWAGVPGTSPDGLCLDKEGCAWFADAANKAIIRVKEGGEVRDRIGTEQDAFQCTFGGADNRTLFVATSLNPFRQRMSGTPGKIIAFDLDVPGVALP